MALPTPISIQRSRGLADLMRRQSFGGPVATPLEGLGRLAQAFSANILSRRADRQEQERQAAARSTLADLLGGAPTGTAGGTMPMGGPTGLPSPAGTPVGGGPATMPPPGGASVMDLVNAAQTFPELQGVLGPIIQSRLSPAAAPESFETLSQEETQRLGFPAGTVVQRNRATGEISVEGKAATPGRPIEIADPSSPTGTRFVTQAEAIGASGPPRQEFRFESRVNPDTGESETIMVRGRRGEEKPAETTTKSTRSKLEQSITTATTALGRVGRISENLNDEFLRLPEQIRMRGAAMAERMGAELGEETRDNLRRFTRFKTSTLSNLNRTLNELSGAAISPAEAERLIAELPSMSDSPTVFRAKIAEIEQAIQSAIRRNQQLLARGVTDLQFDRSGEIKGSDIPTLEEFMLMEETPETTAAGMGSTSAGGPVPERPTAPRRLRFDAEGNIIE